MQEMMIKLAVHIQAMRFMSHFFHNICARVAFFSDHSFFNEHYNQMDSDYDDVIERYIGLFGSETLNLNTLISLSHEKIKSLPSQFNENHAMFNIILNLENELINMCKIICLNPNCSEGTKQMIGDIANMSEIRIYKIKRRMVK